MVSVVKPWLLSVVEATEHSIHYSHWSLRLRSVTNPRKLQSIVQTGVREPSAVRKCSVCCRRENGLFIVSMQQTVHSAILRGFEPCSATDKLALLLLIQLLSRNRAEQRNESFFVKCADILFEAEAVLFQSSAIVKKPVLLSLGKAAFFDSPILMLTSEPDLMSLRRRPVKSTAPHLLQP